MDAVLGGLGAILGGKGRGNCARRTRSFRGGNYRQRAFGKTRKLKAATEPGPAHLETNAPNVELVGDPNQAQATVLRTLPAGTRVVIMDEGANERVPVDGGAVGEGQGHDRHGRGRRRLGASAPTREPG